MIRAAAAAVLAALALPAAAGAARPDPQIATAKAGLAAAVRAGRIAPADAARYRGILDRTAHALPRLGGAREQNLRSVLGDVAAKVDEYTAPRALTLFTMLDVNTRWFGAKGPPTYHADVLGPDGAVYRYFPGSGLQFHPLADVGALNADLAAGRLDTARQLCDALAARAIERSDGSVVWEYEFRYAGGAAPWTSGMAQAVGAQALARASQKLSDPSLLDLARRAEAAVPRTLVRRLAAGPWVKLYSFSSEAVFNAQLQTAVALRDYAAIAQDDAAATLADQMTQAAKTMLPQVDTGYWSLYSVGGAEETRSYHDYVIFLLGRLKAQTQDPVWAATQARFQGYDKQPPLFSVGPPAPAAAYAKKGTAAQHVTFWLSKESSVTVRVGSGSRALWLAHGWHALTWPLPRAQPGLFAVSVTAQPVAGPSASAPLLPLVVLGKTSTRAAASAGTAPLEVGAAENGVLSADPGTAAAQLQRLTGLGLRAVRIAVPWSPGQTAPDPALLPQLQATAQQAQRLGVHVYLEVYPVSAAAAPQDDASRASFVEHLRELAQALPQVQSFVVGTQVNEPAFWPQGPKAAATYLPLLAASYDALKAVSPSIQVVGASLGSAGFPGSWILALGQAYKRSGRTTPVMDALAIQPQNDDAAQPPSFVHPTGPIDIGDYARLVANLKRAFDGTAQPGATLPIVYDGYGVDSAVPPAKASLYGGTETDAVDEATQGSDYAQALQLAACQPNVTALLFQHTIDEQDLGGRQSGLYYPDGTPKSDEPAVQQAIAAAQTPSTCSQPSPPQQGGGEAAPTIQLDGAAATLSCARDCYYVAVLEDAHGVPLRERHGAVKPGVPLTAALPTAGLPAGAYTTSVHLVPRVDPAQAIAQEGQPFTVS
jgi:hypothetical protein